MPKNKKKTIRDETSIRVGNISKVSGSVNIAGGNIATRQGSTGLSAAEIRQLFEPLYSAVETRKETTPATKEDLKTEVQEIQQAVTEAEAKKVTVEESSLSRHFRNIARMAPDIIDVIVATLGSPLAGLGVAVKKIAEKAKEDTAN